MVGLGRLDIPERYVRFGRFDPRVHSLSVSGRGIRYEYTLNYYLALGRAVPQEGFRADSTADRSATSRLRAAVWTEGVEALSEYGEGPWLPGARWEDPRWSLEEDFQVFDLDRDGELDLREWELARLQARREVRKRHAEVANRGAEGVHLLRQPRDGRLFLLANEIPDRIGARYRWWSWIHFTVFTGCGVAGLIML